MMSEFTYLRSLANREPIVRKDYDMPIIFSKPTEHVCAFKYMNYHVICTTCGLVKPIGFLL